MEKDVQMPMASFYGRLIGKVEPRHFTSLKNLLEELVRDWWGND